MIARYFYDRSTGAIGQRWQGPEDQLAANVPANCESIDAAAVIDPKSQRVDVETGAVVDYKPPRPDDSHEWIENDNDGRRVRRWVIPPAIAERRARVAIILDELRVLDARAIRPLAELAADTGETILEPRNTARAVLDEIIQTKETLRAELRDLQR